MTEAEQEGWAAISEVLNYVARAVDPHPNSPLGKSLLKAQQATLAFTLDPNHAS